MSLQADAKTRSGEGRAAKPVPRKPTTDRLSNVAVHYLERYSSSIENLKRVLQRRIARYERASGEHVDGDGLIQEVLRRCKSSGLVDDQRYAGQVAFSHRRRGRSARAIGQRLKAKGVPDELVQEALGSLETSEEHAARRSAERLRLGPWRVRDRADRRDRDIASLCRQGFSLSIARAVIDDQGEGA